MLKGTTKIAKVITASFSDVMASVFSILNIEFVSNVPGSSSSVVLDSYNKINQKNFKISFHEEVAYTTAHSAALLGKRSACLIKSHGLVKAGNSVMDSLSSGTTAGFVTFVFSDKNGDHSDNIFDVIPFIKGLSLPYFILENDKLFEQIEQAYIYSEKYQIPVAIVVDDVYIAQEFNSVIPENYSVTPCFYKRNLPQHLVCPVFGNYQYDVLNLKLRQENWNNIPIPSIPTLADKFPHEWVDTIEKYRPVFEILKNIRGQFVFGDTGISSLFAFEPYNCNDITTYMGGSVPLAVGASLSGYKDIWAITGDFSFIAAGYLGLIEAKNQNTPIKLIVFNNNKAQTTGGQVVNGNLLPIILKGFEEHTRFVKIGDDIESVLKKVKASTGLEIVVIEFN